MDDISTVHNHLTQLEQKGYIRRDPTKPRAIMILKTNDEMDVFYEEDKPFDEMINGVTISKSPSKIPTLIMLSPFTRSINELLLRIRCIGKVIVSSTFWLAKMGVPAQKKRDSANGKPKFWTTL